MKEIVMKVIVMEEAGYKSAMVGLAKSYKKPVETMHEVALKLAPKDKGHNKFLEQMMIWIDIRAPRYWWQEADTYRLSSKSSESTIHTLTREIKKIKDLGKKEQQKYLDADFEPGSVTFEQFQEMIKSIEEKDTVKIKKLLPEGFLQNRMWCMSYKTLRNIILQRWNHILPHWQDFIRKVVKQLENPELLGIKSEIFDDIKKI